MVADVVKDIEQRGTHKFIQAQRKEIYSELKNKMFNQ